MKTDSAEERLPAFYIIEGLFVLESEGVLRGAHALEVRITLTNVGISLPMATATGPSARSLLPERLLSFLPSKLHSCPTIAHKRQPFGPMANQYRTLGRASPRKCPLIKLGNKSYLLDGTRRGELPEQEDLKLRKQEGQLRELASLGVC